MPRRSAEPLFEKYFGLFANPAEGVLEKKLSFLKIKPFYEGAARDP
ncbi:MAG: hypothetical protein ACTHYC_10975 [Sphingobacterium sp.]